MLRRTLNLGIVAHVDAGKTTLTERLLFAAGVIDEIGSVDKGTTQTDSLALERQRGITIKSAVVAFDVDDVRVNLIDTPGHPDFIAEVERVLSVLDGAVLVVSAVEGVQAQTRILSRALDRLGIPTLIFVNKTDRGGADSGRVLAEIGQKLTTPAVPMPATLPELVDVLADNDEALLRAYVADESSVRPHDALVAQTKRALVRPAFCGSAKNGGGVDGLTQAIVEFLTPAAGDADGHVSGRVFKIERGPRGDRVAYVRMFSGTLAARDRVRFGREGAGKVTAINVFERGGAAQRASVSAGEIARVWGLGDVEIGDAVGDEPTKAPAHEFPPPTLESVVVPLDGEDGHRLRLALGQLAEQDPLIDVRTDDAGGEVAVSLYGEVQKEVIAATLADDYGLDVEFRKTTPIYVERPLATGEASELLHAPSNPFNAALGLRVDPAPDGSGVEFRLAVDPPTVPLYVYKTLDGFREHMEEYVRAALREGLFGWQVTDCTVTLTMCNYSVADGPPSRRGPTSTAADFRKLTPIVLVQTLERARTGVCEPMLRVELEIPADTIGAVAAATARLGAIGETVSLRGELADIETVLAAVRVRELQQQLSGLTRGEGVLESTFAGYERVVGDQPVRAPTTARIPRTA